MRAVFRGLIRRPGSTALRVLSLGAGLAMIATLASLAEAILFRPLPVRGADEMVRIATATADQPLGLVSFPDFLDYSRAASVEGAVAQTQVLIAVGDPPVVRMGLAVTPNYFDALGVPAAVGRTFRAGDRDAVILSHAFWKESPRAMGSTLRMGRALFTVIGVVPESFGLERFLHEDFYVSTAAYAGGLLPAQGNPMQDRGRRFFTVYARGHGAVRAEIAAIGARLERDFPETNHGRRALAMTEYEARTLADRNFAPIARMAIAAAILIVAIIVANFAGLSAMAAQLKGRDEWIRTALGATRFRIWRERWLENAAIAAAALALGAPLGWAAARVLAHVAVLPADFHVAIEPRLDWRAAALVAALTAIVGGFGAVRWRRVLIFVEIALAALLVCSDAALISAVARTRRIDWGYRTSGIFVAAIDPAQSGYDESRSRAYFDRLVARLRSVRGVREVALAQSVPLGYTGAQREVVIEGERRAVWINIVTPGYFELMRIAPIEGRVFGPRESDTVVVNRDFARQWGLGCRFRVDGRTVEVIGVVPTATYFYPGEPPRPYFYLPYSRAYSPRMIVHVDGGAVPELMGAIRGVDPGLAVSEARMLADYANQGATFRTRIARDGVAVAGAGGLVLALTGLYGVVALDASRRKKEIAVRIALGSGRVRIVAGLLRRGSVLLIPAVAVGSAGSLAISRDWSVAPAAVAVIGAGFLAMVVPAWRVSSLDPWRNLLFSNNLEV